MQIIYVLRILSCLDFQLLPCLFSHLKSSIYIINHQHHWKVFVHSMMYDRQPCYREKFWYLHSLIRWGCLSFPFTLCSQCLQAPFFRRILSGAQRHILIPLNISSWKNPWFYISKGNNVQMTPQYGSCQIGSQNIQMKTTSACSSYRLIIHVCLSRGRDFQRCLFPQSAVEW
jgi:hypothetical protein